MKRTKHTRWERCELIITEILRCLKQKEIGYNEQVNVRKLFRPANTSDDRDEMKLLLRFI